MSKRRIFCAGFTLTGLLAGCRAGAPPAQQAAPLVSGKPIAAPTPPAHPAAAPDEPISAERPRISDPHPTADALAMEAQAYAKHLEGALAKSPGAGAHKAAGQVQAAAEAPSAQGSSASGAVARVGARDASSVQWIDPKELRLSQSAPDVAAAHIEPARSRNVPLANAGIAATDEAAATSAAPIAPAPSGAPVSVAPTPAHGEIMLNKDTPAVNTPLLVAQPRPFAATDDLARRFQQQVKDYPDEVAAHVDWQLLQFLQGESVPQLPALSVLPQEDREMVATLMDGLTNFRTAIRADNNMLLSRKIRPLLEMADRLRSQAELSIPTLSLCTDVKGFGVYEPIEPARFEAGKDHKVIVYCEVENFSSQLDEQKRWETKLQQEVVLYTEQNGLEVWRDKAPARPIVDYSRNRRHDFFIVKMVKLPAQLTIGRYLLKVTVTDEQVNRVSENTVPIQIVAQ